MRQTSECAPLRMDFYDITPNSRYPNAGPCSGCVHGGTLVMVVMLGIVILSVKP